MKETNTKTEKERYLREKKDIEGKKRKSSIEREKKEESRRKKDRVSDWKKERYVVLKSCAVWLNYNSIRCAKMWELGKNGNLHDQKCMKQCDTIELVRIQNQRINSSLPFARSRIEWKYTSC